MRGRMPATAIMGPNFLSCLRCASQKLVRQSGLAHARRADETHSLIAREIFLERLNAFAIARADGVHGHAGSDRSDLTCRLSGIVGEVCLVEHDDRAARPSLTKAR